MNTVNFVLFYYVVALTLIIVAHKIDPTNLAGPGLDILAYFIVFICSVLLLGLNIYKVANGKKLWSILAIHLLGFGGLITILFMPGH